MGQWRRERDSLVSALEVQLLKLLSCNKEQVQLIKQLRADPGPPPEVRLIHLVLLQYWTSYYCSTGPRTTGSGTTAVLDLVLLRY